MLKAGGPPLIALLGCGCSPATEPVAEISGFSDIVHVRMYRMFAIMSHFATVIQSYMYVITTGNSPLRLGLRKIELQQGGYDKLS